VPVFWLYHASPSSVGPEQFCWLPSPITSPELCSNALCHGLAYAPRALLQILLVHANSHLAVTTVSLNESQQQSDPGTTKCAALAAQVTAHINELLPSILPVTYPYMDGIMDIEATMREALQAMPPDEFIDILRPIFKQDEIKLIIVGGVLGAAAGLLQQYAIFAFV
jgi:uncharacterized membrane protein YheB (UPF0754 family)